MRKLLFIFVLIGLVSFGYGLFSVKYKGPIVFSKEHAVVSKSYLGSVIHRNSEPLDLARVCFEIDDASSNSLLVVNTRYKKGVTKIGKFEKNRYAFELCNNDSKRASIPFEHVNSNKKSDNVVGNILRDFMPGGAMVTIDTFEPSGNVSLCYRILATSREFEEDSFVVEFRRYSFRHGAYFICASIVILFCCFLLGKILGQRNGVKRKI